jgi:hypothetical protein
VEKNESQGSGSSQEISLAPKVESPTEHFELHISLESVILIASKVNKWFENYWARDNRNHQLTITLWIST